MDGRIDDANAGWKGRGGVHPLGHSHTFPQRDLQRERSHSAIWKNAHVRCYKPYLAGTLVLCSCAAAFGQSALRHQIAQIAADAHGKVSVACSLPGTKLNCDLNPHAHPPMQSVFKAPLALAVLHVVENGKLSLDQPIRFRSSDRIQHAYSPLQDEYPSAEVDVPLRQLLSMAVSLSDNVAADILLRLIGGPKAVGLYIRECGVSGFHIVDDEAAMHRDKSLQYRNRFEPAGAVQFLRLLSDHSPVNPEHTALLLGWMRASPANQRIAGRLPAATIVMHKTGTSFTDHGLTAATNDIGLITLPDGRRLAIAVFVTIPLPMTPRAIP